MTENQRKHPPSLLQRGNCGDQRGVVKGFGEVGRNQMGASYKLAPAIGQRKEREVCGDGICS